MPIDLSRNVNNYNNSGSQPKRGLPKRQTNTNININRLNSELAPSSFGDNYFRNSKVLSRTRAISIDTSHTTSAQKPSEITPSHPFSDLEYSVSEINHTHLTIGRQNIDINAKVASFYRHSKSILSFKDGNIECAANNGNGLIEFSRKADGLEIEIIGKEPSLSINSTKVKMRSFDNSIVQLKTPSICLQLYGEEPTICSDGNEITIDFYNEGLIKYEDKESSIIKKTKSSAEIFKLTLKFDDKYGLWQETIQIGLIDVDINQENIRMPKFFCNSPENNSDKETTISRAIIFQDQPKNKIELSSEYGHSKAIILGDGRVRVASKIRGEISRAKAAGNKSTAIIDNNTSYNAMGSLSAGVRYGQYEMEVKGRKSSTSYNKNTNKLTGTNKGRGEIKFWQDKVASCTKYTRLLGSKLNFDLHT